MIPEAAQNRSPSLLRASKCRTHLVSKYVANCLPSQTQAASNTGMGRVRAQLHCRDGERIVVVVLTVAAEKEEEEEWQSSLQEQQQ